MRSRGTCARPFKSQSFSSSSPWRRHTSSSTPRAPLKSQSEGGGANVKPIRFRREPSTQTCTPTCTRRRAGGRAYGRAEERTDGRNVCATVVLRTRDDAVIELASPPSLFSASVSRYSFASEKGLNAWCTPDGHGKTTKELTKNLTCRYHN